MYRVTITCDKKGEGCLDKGSNPRPYGEAESGATAIVEVGKDARSKGWTIQRGFGWVCEGCQE